MKIRIFLIVFFSFNLVVTQNLIIKPIESTNLEQELILFEKFSAFFCGVSAENRIFSQVILDTFQTEEKDFLEKSPTVLFFHALFDEQVVGYISCDLLPGHYVHIRQLIVDPEIFTVGLAKELLFVIFENYPKTKLVSVSCLAGCSEMIQFFKDLGFVKSDPILKSSLEICSIYELKVSSKCKICELLYPNIWEDEDDDIENSESQEEEIEV
ncbi:GNAT family N-acetyltransferase [Candidatus Dependentiae bacterium]|nr:GNAT family N-acetyltransferase [Candidatus Dependentiae bacterium]